MSTFDNKKMLRDLVPIAFNTGDISVIDKLLAEDAIDHSGLPGQKAGREGIKNIPLAFREAFPDLKFTFEDLLSEGDFVAARWIIEGTHKGRFLSMAPTNKWVRINGISIIRFNDGKMVERWSHSDALQVLSRVSKSSID